MDQLIDQIHWWANNRLPKSISSEWNLQNTFIIFFLDSGATRIRWRTIDWLSEFDLMLLNLDRDISFRRAPRAILLWATLKPFAFVYSCPEGSQSLRSRVPRAPRTNNGRPFQGCRSTERSLDGIWRFQCGVWHSWPVGSFEDAGSHQERIRFYEHTYQVFSLFL